MSFKVHEGSFGKGQGSFDGQTFHLPKRIGWGLDSVGAAALAEADIASEESVKRVAGTLGWGAAGALTLGPVGLLAGLLLGGKKTEKTFICTFVDGRWFIATGDLRTWIIIKSASLAAVAANREAAARKAAVAQELASRPPPPPEPPKNATPIEVVEWAFQTGQWQYRRLPKQGYERFASYKGKKGTRTVLLIYTPDPVTDHSLSAMASAMTDADEWTEKIIISSRSAASSDRMAAQLGITIGTLADLKLVIAR